MVHSRLVCTAHLENRTSGARIGGVVIDPRFCERAGFKFVGIDLRLRLRIWREPNDGKSLGVLIRRLGRLIPVLASLFGGRGRLFWRTSAFFYASGLEVNLLELSDFLLKSGIFCPQVGHNIPLGGAWRRRRAPRYSKKMNNSK